MRKTELGFTIPEIRNIKYRWYNYSKKINQNNDVINYTNEKDFIKDTKNLSKSGLKILIIWTKNAGSNTGFDRKIPQDKGCGW